MGVYSFMIHMKGLISILVILLFSSQNIAQNISMVEAELELAHLLSELRNAINDEDKTEKNEIFKAKLETVLHNEQALLYPFSRLTTVGFIDSPDKQMRIINWNVEQDDFSHKYNCFVLHIDKRSKKHYVSELIDNSTVAQIQPSGILTSGEWYGALYYKIIPVKKGRRIIYTVLGWDYYSSLSQVKLIDAIYFTGKNVKIGNPIFKSGKQSKNRIFFEHSKKTTMSLKYETQRERIIFDHLSPESPTMKKFKSFYVPDMTYDAFVLNGNKWVLFEDVIATNKDKTGNKQILYVKNEKTGKVERKEVKMKWENPEDMDAPGGAIEHVAITPETAQESNEKSDELKDNKLKADKRDKRDPSLPTFYYEVKKNKKRIKGHN